MPPSRVHSIAKLPPRLAKNRRRGSLLVWALLACTVLSGCNTMFRRMTIRSEPSGALVLIDGREVGYTPYTADFIYYGTREITLIKDGFETLTVMQEFPPPWYQVPPIDFVTDNFLPFVVTNRQEYCYQLQPQVIVPAEELLDRARSLRSQSQIGP